MTFGKKLQNLRRVKGLEQEQLALELNVSRQMISKWEMGDIPDINNVIRISYFFDCSIDYLLKDEIEEHKFKKSNLGDNKIVEKKRMQLDTIFLITTIIPLIILFIIWIISRIVPYPLTRIDLKTGYAYTGFSGFIDYYRITGLVYCCVVSWLISITVRFILQLLEEQRYQNKKYVKLRGGYYILLLLGTWEYIIYLREPWNYMWNTDMLGMMLIYGSILVALNLFAKNMEGRIEVKNK